jgi:hypothetical protein
VAHRARRVPVFAFGVRGSRARALLCVRARVQSKLATMCGEAAFRPMEESAVYHFARSLVIDIADLVPKIVGGVRKACGLPAR